MIRPFSIALVYGGNRSYNYAKEMKSLIEKKGNHLPLIPLLVDTNDNGIIFNTILDTFKSSDYAYIFVSQVYKGTKINEDKQVSMATPNLLLELGYLIKKIGLENIKIILDFSYDDVKDGFFVFPSDLNGDYLCAKPELMNDSMNIEILREILDMDLNKIQRIKNFSSIDQIHGLKAYLPDYQDVFQWEIDIENINEYSLDKQYKMVFENWKNELLEFQHMEGIASDIKDSYIIMYLYERLLFFPVFHGITGINITEMKVSMRYSESLPNKKEGKLYNAIIDYIKGQTNGNSAFFKNYIDFFNNNKLEKINPLIYIIVQNYLGLCYLNYFLCLRKESIFIKIEKQKEILDSANLCFCNATNKCEIEFQGTLDSEMIKAFAYYNNARVLCEKYVLNNDPLTKVNWINQYNLAIECRKQLSEEVRFPQFIRLYFKNEMYHAQNRKIMEQISFWERNQNLIDEEEIRNAKLNGESIFDELKKYEETIVAGQPFFRTIKNNVSENLGRLNNLM